MYGIFAYIYIYHQNKPNVGKYTIHGWYLFDFEGVMSQKGFILPFAVSLSGKRVRIEHIYSICEYKYYIIYIYTYRIGCVYTFIHVSACAHSLLIVALYYYQPQYLLINPKKKYGHVTAGFTSEHSQPLFIEVSAYQYLP